MSLAFSHINLLLPKRFTKADDNADTFSRLYLKTTDMSIFLPLYNLLDQAVNAWP